MQTRFFQIISVLTIMLLLHKSFPFLQLGIQYIYIIDVPPEKWVSVFYVPLIPLADFQSCYVSPYTHSANHSSHPHLFILTSMCLVLQQSIIKRCTPWFLQQYSNKTELFLPLSVQICGCILTLHIDYCCS